MGRFLFLDRLGAGGAYFASPVAAAGNVYLASGEGMISVIRGSEQFAVLVRNDLRESIFTTPPIVRDAVFVRTSAALYAFAELR